MHSCERSRENLLAYGLGRVIDYHDMPVVRPIDARSGQE